MPTFNAAVVEISQPEHPVVVAVAYPKQQTKERENEQKYVEAMDVEIQAIPAVNSRLTQTCQMGLSTGSQTGSRGLYSQYAESDG